jgi:O-antigen/teichoic acid export membrane protein
MAIESAFYLAITRFRLAPASYRGAGAADALGLVRCGLPYVLVSFVGALVLGMDKLFLMESAAASRVGIYQMASMPLLMGVSLGAVVNQYLFPSLLREYGRHGSVRAVHQRMRTILLRLLAGFLLLIPLEYLAAHVVIVWFLPEYTESLPVRAVFCVSGAFTAANVSGITLYARNRPRLFLVSSGIVTLLAFPVLFWLNQQPDVALLWYAVVNACVIVLEFVLRFLFAGACARAEA